MESDDEMIGLVGRQKAFLSSVCSTKAGRTSKEYSLGGFHGDACKCASPRRFLFVNATRLPATH